VHSTSPPRAGPQLAAQEEVKLKAERAAAAAIEAEHRAQVEAAKTRASAHNLLAHSPDAWWEVLRDASPPTALVVLTNEHAACLRRILRRLLKATRPGHERDKAVDALLVRRRQCAPPVGCDSYHQAPSSLVPTQPLCPPPPTHTTPYTWFPPQLDCQAALDFFTARLTKGAKAALTIQRLGLQFMARRRCRARIFTRWEKRYDKAVAGYVFVDVVAEQGRAACEAKAKEYARTRKPYDDDEASVDSRTGKPKKGSGPPRPFAPPPWAVVAPGPPTVLRKIKFNPTATPTASMGTPRATRRKLANEAAAGDARLARERELRPGAAVRASKGRVRVHLCACVRVCEGVRLARW